MMYIFFSENSKVPPVSYHIGEDKDFFRKRVHMVVSVQADGEELEHIRWIFTPSIDGKEFPVTIPFPRRSVVKWYGDIAKCIVGNL